MCLDFYMLFYRVACAVVAGFLFFLAGEPRVLRLSRDSLKSACAVVAGYNHGM